jgi:RNA polymerase sigma-70 factor (ECF subfamily)
MAGMARMIRMTDEAERGHIAQAQAGDRRAFGMLVREYQDRVFRFILRLNGARDEAMDLTQETFMKAHQALPDWRPEAQFRTWLFSIAHNLTLDVLRRRQRIEFVATEDLAAGDAGHDLPDPARQPDQRLADRQSIEMLERTLLELPVEHREILLLREVEDMSYDEIAATLGIAAGTVKSRLARARSAALAGYQRHTGEHRDD